ncbi:MAG: hypothetical protein ABSA75_04340 [Candidatus Bathyarchaeia archaeon]
MYTMDDLEVNQFLDSIEKPSTKATYKTSMKFYLDFTGKSGKELLEIKKADKDFKVEESMMAFKKWILEEKWKIEAESKPKTTKRGTVRKEPKPYSSSFAVNAMMTARSFYAYYRMPLVFRKQEAKTLKQKTRTTQDYLFDKEDLAKMALVADLKQRYVLLLGKSVGLRASDFTTFTYGQFRCLKLDNDAPIAIGEIMTQKENVLAYPFLDSDAIPIVKQILESNRDKKDSDKIIVDTEDNLSVVLQTLAKKAGIDPHGKRIRFHCLRKFTIDHLSALASESQWKQIVGKAISEGAYVSQDQLRGVYLRAMPSLLINGNGIKAKKLIELENALRAVESENATSKTRIDLLQKTVEELKKSIEGLYHIQQTFPKTLEHTLFNKKTGKMETYFETVNNPQEQEESIKKFQEKAKKLSEAE